MNVYEKLGVTQYINAKGTYTMVGGSIMPDEVIAAMKEAAGSYVDILELHRKSGDYIAKLTHNEAAFVSNGAAAGFVLATAAAVAGDDRAKRDLLPLSDSKNEIIVSKTNRSKNRYDSAIKLGGGKHVLYGDETCSTEAQLEAAITPNTVAIYMYYYQHRMENQPSFEAQVRIAKKHDIYLFVDAAAQLPRKENLWRFTHDGADLAIFSGGKDLRGPQSSGLVVGRRDLIDRILTITSPNKGIGRPFKVGKEEIIGLMKAVELYMDTDEEAMLAEYERQVEYVVDSLTGFHNGVEVTRVFPGEAGKPIPWVQFRLIPSVFPAGVEEIDTLLKMCKPAILVNVQGDLFYVNPQMLLKGEMQIVVDSIKDVLRKKGGRK